MNADTLPKLLLANAARIGDRPAYREKALGIWQATTWRQAADRVRDFALGLEALGFGLQDKLGVLSDNRPRAIWAMLAAQGLRGIAVPVYQDAAAAEIAHVLAHADVTIVVAEDQEQVDKLVETRAKLPALRQIIYLDPKGMRRYRDPILTSYAEVEAKGRARSAENPGRFETSVTAGSAEDVALFLYTSGSTGTPKGVMLTHGNLLAAAEGYLTRERCTERDEMLSYLPLAWVGEVAWSLAAALKAGMVVNCPEEPETVLENLRELGPTVFLAAPRIWENLLSSLQVRIEDAGWVKRRLYQAFVGIGTEIARKRLAGATRSLRERLLGALGELLVFGAVRDHLGLRRVRYAYTGGAGLGPEALLLIRGIGVNLKQVYGLTETMAFTCGHPDDAVKPETVGPPFPGLELRIAPGGEVCFRGPSVFAGYYKAPELTAEALRDGWFHTGDAGLVDGDGHLTVVDRARDVGALADGTAFAPQFVENKLKFSSYVREAVALGTGRPWVGALLNIDLNTVGNWAERRNLPFAGYTDLSQKPEVYALIQGEVRRINDALPQPLRVRRFLILHKELDPDDAEITRTRKVRRGVVAQRYRDLIEGLYGTAESLPVTTTVTYEDGRTAEVRGSVRLQHVDAVGSTAPTK
jgi:long-chain acyl-CoA synthetase